MDGSFFQEFSVGMVLLFEVPISVEVTCLLMFVSFFSVHVCFPVSQMW